MKTRVLGILFAAMGTLSCGAGNEGAIVIITGIGLPTRTAATATEPATCVCSAIADATSVFLSSVGFVAGGTTPIGVCMNATNQLLANGDVRRPNTNDVYIEEIRVNYEGVGGSVSIPEQVVQVNAYIGAGGGETAFGALVVPAAVRAQLDAVDAARARVHLRGKTTDGNSFKSNEFSIALLKSTVDTAGTCP